mmetsp:Transcript_6723/g.19435  ORF Transcript_6723/g.19435 Transcript_6723/m.19435 type:complete len:293 (+) Transcript_6723:432-1310(+)
MHLCIDPSIHLDRVGHLLQQQLEIGLVGFEGVVVKHAAVRPQPPQDVVGASRKPVSPHNAFLGTVDLGANNTGIAGVVPQAHDAFGDHELRKLLPLQLKRARVGMAVAVAVVAATVVAAAAALGGFVLPEPAPLPRREPKRGNGTPGLVVPAKVMEPAALCVLGEPAQDNQVGGRPPRDAVVVVDHKGDAGSCCCCCCCCCWVLLLVVDLVVFVSSGVADETGRRSKGVDADRERGVLLPGSGTQSAGQGGPERVSAHHEGVSRGQEGRDSCRRCHRCRCRCRRHRLERRRR